MKDFLSFNFFKYSWNTERYLCYISFFYFLLSLYLYKDFRTTLDINIFWIVLILIYTIFLITWLFSRLNFTYFFNKVYVIFAITVDQEDKQVLKHYREVIHLFKEKIKDQGFNKKIKVITKHFDVRFNKHSAAEAKTKLNIVGHTIVISGMPITSLGEIEFKFNFHYEFACPRNTRFIDIIKASISKKVNKAIYGRDWCIRNSVDSKKKLTGNLLSVSSYILALSMLSIKEYKTALEFLQPIIQQCNTEPSKFGPLIAELRELLFAIYDSEFNDKIWNLKSEENRELAEKMYKYDKYNYNSCMAMALVSELENDRVKAKEYTDQAELCHPKNIFSYELNRLYFCLSEGDVNNIDVVMNKLKQSANLSFNFTLLFLEKKYQETFNPLLLFNSAVVSRLGGQEDIANRSMEEFKKFETDVPNYDLLIKRYDELLN